MATGTVSVFNRDKLYAEIEPDGGGDLVTAFMQEISAARLHDLQVGERVSYDVGSDGHVSRISRA
ncbi:hypothetical protein C4J95_3711 [Pseudomonas orientalis]|uniref:cold-shock protein n=1 Tax=Pseudomonas orientalis TaxID=76758 RepID=UPI000F578745|nr:cold shock domain-containing protein [Pseudomonas orientalis]AZE95741.1 hypothetical protein C4J96_3642 [Pseudomonas orientalis]AZF01156.1 hypothetical protein C4J95_3711 [Pseudomonas orientalis]